MIFLIEGMLLHACKTQFMKCVLPKLVNPHRPFVFFQCNLGFVISVFATNLILYLVVNSNINFHERFADLNLVKVIECP